MKRKLTRQMIRRRNELRDAARTQTPVPRTLTVGSTYLRKRLTMALRLLLTQNCTPDNFNEANRLVEDQSLFDTMFDGQSIIIFFRLRGQSACDLVWGTGGLPSALYKRQQIVGQLADDSHYSQMVIVQQSPMAIQAFSKLRDAIELA